MPYFLSEQKLSAGATALIEGAQASHLLKSRRYRNGERFAMQDPAGRRWLVELVEDCGRAAAVKVLEALPLPEPPPLSLHLLPAAIKDKAADWLIQKATELGVSALSFHPAANSTVSHKLLAASHTLARWEKIAWEACKQCDRQYPPRLQVLGSFELALGASQDTGLTWLLDPAGEPPQDRMPGMEPSAAKSARVLVGPEGGFTEGEIAAAQVAGFAPIKLGGQTLRAETAALAAASLLLFGG
ncbi:MAG: RsmE family RNA methyltransferase [SAR324 cluster bacterium]|nr:RsmE family RNA methyltransferase [SAR324 cluster bacterium]